MRDSALSMNRDQVADVDRVAALVDADRARLRIDDDDRCLGDTGDWAGAVARRAEAGEVLTGTQPVIAAAIEHHEVTGRRHLAAFVAEDEMSWVRKIRLASCFGCRGNRRLHEQLEIVSLLDGVAHLDHGGDGRIRLRVLDSDPTGGVNARSLDAVAGGADEAVIDHAADIVFLSDLDASRGAGVDDERFIRPEQRFPSFATRSDAD